MDSSSAWKIWVVVDVRGAELLRFLLGDGLFRLVDGDAGLLRSFAGSFLLLLGHLFEDRDLVRSQLANGEEFFYDDALRDDGLELVVDEINRVDFS